MTSLYPHQNGMMGLCHRGFRLNDRRQHLSHLLRDAGYLTQLVGFQHEVPWDEIERVLGYNAVVPCQGAGHSARRAKVAADWLGKKPRQPFFLNVGFSETHRPFSPVESPEDERYVAPLPWLADDPQIRRDLAELNTAVRHVDDGVGIVRRALEEQRLLDNSLVIFTTDHGVPFPRAKSTLFDAGIGVALILRGPGGFSGGRAVDALVSQLDLLPTFFQLAGLPVPAYAQGVSLLPLVQPAAAKVRDEIFAEITYHAAYDPGRCIRTQRHKFIRYFEDRPRWLNANVDDGPSKERLRDWGLPVCPWPRRVLFDLAADPQEFENVAEWPEYASVREELEQRLDAWMKETDDPILKGPVPLPPGGVLTPSTAYSPSEISSAGKKPC